MVLKCFVRNDKVDSVEQCHDEWRQAQFIIIETQHYSVRMLATCCKRRQYFTNESLWLVLKYILLEEHVRE